jgi:hypothetical protein
MKAVAASLEGRHRAPRGLTGPCGPGRGVGACVGPAQARGSPLRDRVPTGRRLFPGRRPRPSPCPTTGSSGRTGPPAKGGLPRRAAWNYILFALYNSRISGRAVEGGSTLLPAMRFVYTKLDRGLPAACRPGGIVSLDTVSLDTVSLDAVLCDTISCRHPSPIRDDHGRVATSLPVVDLPTCHVDAHLPEVRVLSVFVVAVG